MLKLMLRELRKNWKQYLSMFVITLLAVTLFLGFISNTLTLRARSEEYLKESNLASLVLQTSGMDDSDREYLEELDLNSDVEYRIYSDGSFALEKDGEGAEPFAAKIYIGDNNINKPYLVEGEKGFLVDKTIADMNGIKVGDKVSVEITSYGLSLDFEITGFMYSVEGVNIYSNSPVAISDDAFVDAMMESMELPEALRGMIESTMEKMRNQALLLCDDAAAMKEAIQARFNEKETNNLIFVFDRASMESVVILDNEVEQSKTMLYIFPVIFFLVSILVIMTSISRLILRERINIGTFKALGMSDGKITFHYAFMSAVITFFGCVVGAIIGPPIVSSVMTVKYGLTFSMPTLTGLVYSWPWMCGTTAVVCCIALLIGVWASRSVMKENPAECMRPKQITYHPRAGETNRGGGNQALLSFRMAFRNIRINRGRSVMTVVGILGCTALLVTSFGIGDTMNSSVANDYGYLLTYDVTSTYTAEAATMEKLEELKEDGEIEFYEKMRSYAVTASGTTNKDISVYIIPENSVMCKAADGGNTISEITASVVGVGVGDTITFTLGSCKVEYEIEAIIPTATWNGFFTTEDKFTDCYSTESVWVKTDSPQEVRDALNEVNGTAAAQTMEDRIAEVNNLISTSDSMKYTLMVFAILLSVVVLYNLSLLNVKERTRDMATLKVLGFDNFRIALALIVEILTLTLIGTAIGCLFGYPLMYLVMKLNEVAAMAFIYSITAASYFKAIAVSLGTSAFINILFGFLISKISMTESLKSVE